MVWRHPFKDFEVFKICCKISYGECKCPALPSRLLLTPLGRHQSCDQQGSKENTGPREIINKQEEKEKLPPPAASFFNAELLISTHQILSGWYSFGSGQRPRKLWSSRVQTHARGAILWVDYVIRKEESQTNWQLLPPPPSGGRLFVTSALSEDLTALQKCPDRHNFTSREGELPWKSSCSLTYRCKEQGQSTPPLLSMGVVTPLHQQRGGIHPPWMI